MKNKGFTLIEIIIVIAIIGILISIIGQCTTKKRNNSIFMDFDTVQTDTQRHDTKIITVDGCQYVHVSNCNNPIHKGN